MSSNSNICNTINCLVHKTNCLSKTVDNITKYVSRDGIIRPTQILPFGPNSTIGDNDNKFKEIYTEELYVDNESIHFINVQSPGDEVVLKATAEGCLVTTDVYGNNHLICPCATGATGATGEVGIQGATGATGATGEDGSLTIIHLDGVGETGMILGNSLVFSNATRGVYTLGNTGNTGSEIRIIKSKNAEEWEAIVNTTDGYPNRKVYTIFRDGPTGDLYIGGEWKNNLSGIPNTQNLARLPAANLISGNTGGWEAVVNTTNSENTPNGYPDGRVNTIFRDGPTGDLYIGGQWAKNLSGIPNTQNLARLPAANLISGNTGGWEAVVNTTNSENTPNGYPDRMVNTIFRDGPTGDLYIGGSWINNLSDIPNTQRLARLPAANLISGNTGGWEAVVDTTDGYPNGPVNTIFRDGPTGYLYIGGAWINSLSSNSNTQNLARLPAANLISGNTGGWEAVVDTTDGYPDGTVYTIFRDGPTSDLYIGGQWAKNLSGIPNTQNLARLPAANLISGNTGGWEAVVNTTNSENTPNGYPDGQVYTIFRDGPTGYLYIGGSWINNLSDIPNTQRLARLPAANLISGNTGGWEAVVDTTNSENTPNDYPDGTVYSIFRDGPTSDLYIGGQWAKNLSGIPNTKNLATFKNSLTLFKNEDNTYTIPRIGDNLNFIHNGENWIKLY